MGHEISNLSGIFGGFRLPKMLRLMAGVISLGPGTRMGWDDTLLFYVFATYASVYLLSPHLASPYGYKMIPQLLSPYHYGFSLLKNAFKWNTMVSSQWLNIAHTFSLIRDNVPYLEGGTITCLLGRGKRKKQEFNLLLKPSESCQQERLLFVWFLSETADPLGPRKAHIDLLLKRHAFWFAFSSGVLIRAK